MAIYSSQTLPLLQTVQQHTLTPQLQLTPSGVIPLVKTSIASFSSSVPTAYQTSPPANDFFSPNALVSLTPSLPQQNFITSQSTSLPPTALTDSSLPPALSPSRVTSPQTFSPPGFPPLEVPQVEEAPPLSDLSQSPVSTTEKKFKKIKTPKPQKPKSKTHKKKKGVVRVFARAFGLMTAATLLVLGAGHVGVNLWRKRNPILGLYSGATPNVRVQNSFFTLMALAAAATGTMAGLVSSGHFLLKKVEAAVLNQWPRLAKQREKTNLNI